MVSENEFQSNFRNHNPLYLDIAVDAKIIYDNGFLDVLITETREYIKSKKIIHSDGSWSFPVEDRAITYF